MHAIKRSKRIYMNASVKHLFISHFNALLFKVTVRYILNFDDFDLKMF